MSHLTYPLLKAAATLIRLTQPSPATPIPSSILQIPSRDSVRTIKAHVYNSNTPTTPSPVFLNFHGSGFVIPFHGSDDVFCRRIANETKYTVLDIQYRLAPEHPFPAALHDVEDAIKYVLSQPEKYDSTRISISGFSAGGNLALAVLSSTAIPANSVYAVLAFYPPVDLSIEPGEKVQPDPEGKNTIPAMGARLFNACYFRGGEADTKDPLVSPAFMDVGRLPGKVLLVTCAYDTLALETERLGERVKMKGPEGRDLVCRRVEGVSHAWDKSCGVGSEEERKRDEVYGWAIDLLNR